MHLHDTISVLMAMKYIDRQVYVWVCMCARVRECVCCPGKMQNATVHKDSVETDRLQDSQSVSLPFIQMKRAHVCVCVCVYIYVCVCVCVCCLVGGPVCVCVCVACEWVCGVMRCLCV